MTIVDTAVPTDAVPTDAVPTDAVPTDAVPTSAVPTDAELIARAREIAPLLRKNAAAGELGDC